MWIFVSMNANITERRKDTLVNMCDESKKKSLCRYTLLLMKMHNIKNLFFGRCTSLIDKTRKSYRSFWQKIFAEYTARTAFERPLMSRVAYALRVLHTERGRFEQQHAWQIKKMETEFQSLVKDDYNPEKLDPSPVQDEYAPVIFSQETVSHIVSIDMMSGKTENILRARAARKGVLTSCNLLKSNHLGVVLTFAVYKTNLPLNAAPQERIETTVGYLGASFDVPSLVERLLQQLASKQTIIVNLYDTTNVSAPIRMYGPDTAASGEMHISYVDFGDPTRKHEMHCRFKHKPPLPWSAITMLVGVAVIVLLVGHIFHAALNRIEEVEDDYCQMRELKVQAESADVAKYQFLATVSHEIRTRMNGVLGFLQMLMDTDLDATQQDFAMTAQSSGKALIALINEVLDQAKIESGRLELEAVPFDLRDVLDNVLSLFSDKSQAKGIEMAVYVSERVPEILIGDPGRLRQIITNLVGNSVKVNCSSNFLIIQLKLDLVVWYSYGEIETLHLVPYWKCAIPVIFSRIIGTISLVSSASHACFQEYKYILDTLIVDLVFKFSWVVALFSFIMMKKIILLQTWYFSCLSCACYPSFSLLKFSMGRLDVVIICLKLSNKKNLALLVMLVFFFRSVEESVLTWKNGAAMPLGSLPNMFLVVTSQSPTEVHELKSAGYVDSTRHQHMN
ncbi:unnamed protein product [Musa acuminata var. zebrina]